MRVLAVATGALSLLCFAFGQTQIRENQRLSLSIEPTSVGSLCERLSSETGVKLRVATSLRDEVLVLSVHDVSAREVLRRISLVTGASWTEVKDGLLLEQTAGDSKVAAENRTRYLGVVADRFQNGLRSRTIKPFDDAEGKAWAARIKVARAKLAEVNRDKSDFDWNYYQQLSEKFDELRAVTAAKRLLDRILTETDIVPMLSVAPGQTLIFSPSPNRMQRSLAVRSRSLFEEFKQENKTLLPYFQELWPDSDEQRAYGTLGFRSELQVKSVSPQAIMFVEATSWRPGHLRFELKVVNPDGGVAAHAVETRSSDEEAPQAKFSPAVLSSPLDLPLALSQAVEWLANPPVVYGAEPEVAPFLRPYMSDPLDHEWLALSPTSLLMGFAAKAEVNLIGEVPDSLLAQTPVMARDFKTMGQKVFTGGYLLGLLSRSGMQTRLEDGWCTVEPVIPGNAQSTRMNRRVFKSYLSILGQGRSPSFEEWLDLAAKPGSAELSHFISDGPSAYLSPHISSAACLRELALFASLTPAQRQRALGSDGIPLSALTVPQRAAIDEVVFYRSDTRYSRFGNDDAPDDVTWSEFLAEPTLLLPHGIPFEARVSFDQSSAPCFLAAGEGGVFQFDTGWMMGQKQFRYDRWLTSQKPASKILGGSHTFGRGHLRLGKFTRVLSRFDLTTLDFRKVVPLAKAPASFLESVKAGYEAAKAEGGGDSSLVTAGG